MKKLISLLVVIAIVLSVFVMPVTEARVMADTGNGVEDFVTRLYDVCLNRTPDEAGLRDWSDRLINHEATGVSAAYGFIFSNEFQSRNCSDTEYVTYMYSAFFGRTPDEEGLNTWVTLLGDGASRESVFCGFANSSEFGSLCASYGIIRGFHMEGKDFMQMASINLFVERLYNEVLGRSCDNQGMEEWTFQLASHANTGCGVAYGFVFSPEFINKHYCNEHYVEVLYKAFLGREADSSGKATWIDFLNKPASREEVFNGFAGSDEFKKICAAYGIDSGILTLQGTGTYASGACSICGRDDTPALPTPEPTPTPEPEKITISPNTYFYITDDDRDGVKETAHIYCTSSEISYDSYANPVTSLTQHNGEFTRAVFDTNIGVIPRNFFKDCTSLKEVVLPETVWNFGENSFSGTGLTSFVVPKNVTVINQYSFKDCKQLSSFTFEERTKYISMQYHSLAGCSSLTSLSFPQELRDNSHTTIIAECTSLKEIYFGSDNVDYSFCDDWSNLEKVVMGCYSYNHFLNTVVEDSVAQVEHRGSDPLCLLCNPPAPIGEDATKYSYEIIPIYENYNKYIFVKTDNPDPESFDLFDPDSKLTSVKYHYRATTTRFADVSYEDYDTGRFDGGYIFPAIYCDGGELALCQYASMPTYGNPQKEYIDTGIRIKCPELTDVEGLLMNNCYDEYASFFENMNSIQQYLNSHAIYPISLLDPDSETGTPYFSLIPPAYSDQSIMIISGRFKLNNEVSLVLDSYPYMLDSASFPSLMSRMARRLNPDCVVRGVSYEHDLVQITYDGKTYTFGGQGSHGKYGYTSRQSTGTLFPKHLSFMFTSIESGPDDWFALLEEYWNRSIEENTEQYELFSTENMRKTIGPDGSWLRINGGYYIFSSCSAVFGNKDVWVDGRYCNSDGLFMMNATLANHPTSSILLTNVTYKNYKGDTLTGDVLYKYDSSHDAWYSASAYGSLTPNSNSWRTSSYDEVLKNSPELVLTRQQVEAMQLERNTSTFPEHGLYYDGVDYPGTPF